MIPIHSVLVVDDDDLLLKTIAKSLAFAGYDVTTASAGVQGYASFFRRPTTWVVSDIQMPDLSGIEMMCCIRGIAPTVKTIYISGAIEDYSEQLRAEEVQFGARILAKPFALKALLEMMKRPRPYAPNMAVGARIV